ncbi:TPA: fimbrial protein [Serratia marcescens]
MKSIFKVTAIGALLSVGVSSAYAAGNNTRVVIQGDVVPVSCDIGSTSGPAPVDLGNAMPSDFTAGTGIYAGFNTSIKNQKDFYIGLGGCSGTVASGKYLELQITDAPSLPGHPTLLGGGVGSTTMSFGSLLTSKKTLGGADALLQQGDTIQAFKYTSTDGAEADGATVKFTATMATATTAQVGHMVAPVTFSLAYN